MSGWDEAWLQAYEAKRASQRDPVARGGVEAGGYALQARSAERPAEPKRGRARTAASGSLAVGGSGSRPVKSRQAGGSPAQRDPMLVMGEPPAVEEQNATGSYRRAGVALRTPEAAGESGPQRPTKRNKFGAVRTVAPASWGGTRLADSKAGAQLARTLDTRKQVGSILDWAEEVSIPVGVDEDGKVIRYRADALVLLGYVDAPDGGEPALVVRLIDAKKRGMDTPTSKTKRAALRARGWNVEIHET